MRFSSRFTSENKFSILLCWAVLSSVAYIYCCRMVDVAVLFAVFSFVYTVLLIAMFDFFKRKNKVLLTTVGIVGGFAVISLISGAVMDTTPYIMFKWYMQPQEYGELYVGNIFSLLLLIGYILTACAYYFTMVRYSRVFVFLICMSPFALYAKTFTEIPAIFMILITTAYFILLLQNGSPGVSKKAFALSAAALMLSVTVLASFLPKLDAAPFRKDFDELITGVSMNVGGGTNFGDFSNTSATDLSTDDRTVIYYIGGDAPLLIKGRIYNQYNAEKNAWEYYGDQNNGSNSWRRKSDRYYPETLAAAIGASHALSDVKEYRLYTPTDTVQVIYTPENPVGISGSGFTATSIYRNELDEYFFSYEDKCKFSGYTVKYTCVEYDPDFSKKFGNAIKNGIKNDDRNAVEYYIEAREEAKQYDTVFFGDLYKCYKRDTAYEEIDHLVDKLTAGLSTDYEKALAIQKYLLGKDFKYDLNYKPADNSIENFILNTKRGTCSKYATAMTLMLRHCGITARYVEGFLVTRYDEEKHCNYVTAADSHAYVQAWIEGYGWMDFDPTSMNQADPSEGNITFYIVGAAAFTAAAAGVLFFALRPRVKEARFKHRISRTRGKKQAALIYERIVGILLKKVGESENIFTPTEINTLSMQHADCDLTGFIGRYSALAYGKTDDETLDMSSAYSVFTECLKRKKHRK